MSNESRNRALRWPAASVMLLCTLLAGAAASAAQDPDATDLDALVAPIALYPDDLLAIVLPASTYPLQVVQAARFLTDSSADRMLQPDPDWDDSIIALLNYPEVLESMNQDLDWTWALGEAVIEREAEVLAAVSDFRARANAAGNLVSDDRQIVEVVDQAIEIRPADPEVIYVPYYEPERVVVYQPTRVVHYYPRRYPLYYYPYPAGYAFYNNSFWGVTSAYSIGWTTRHLHLHYREWDSHPYYGYNYLDRYYYRRPSVVVYKQYVYPRHSGRHHEGNYWQRRHYQAGARPHQRTERDNRGGGTDLRTGHGRDQRGLREQQAWQPDRNGRTDSARIERAGRERSRIEQRQRSSQRISTRSNDDGPDRAAVRTARRPESRPAAEPRQRRNRDVAAATPAPPKDDSARPARSKPRQPQSSEPKPQRSERGSNSPRSQQKAVASGHENDKLRGRFLR